MGKIGKIRKDWKEWGEIQQYAVTCLYANSHDLLIDSPHVQGVWISPATKNNFKWNRKVPNHAALDLIPLREDGDCGMGSHPQARSKALVTMRGESA